MTIFAVLGAIAAIIGIASYIPYVLGIMKGKTKPHRTTFGIWAVIGMVQVISYAVSGARATLLLPAVYALGALVIFILSLKRGVGGTQKIDLICLALATVGIIGWILTDNPHIALYLSILASACGFLLTIKKAYVNPETENTFSWCLAALAAILNVLALSQWELHAALYPMYLLLFDGAMALLTLFPALRHQREHEVIVQE
jgi:hypothetical protein